MWLKQCRYWYILVILQPEHVFSYHATAKRQYENAYTNRAYNIFPPKSRNPPYALTGTGLFNPPNTSAATPAIPAAPTVYATSLPAHQ